MKKVLALCAMFVLAATTQAASINWGMGNVYEPGTTTKAAAGSYTAYLFATDSNTGLQTTTLDVIQGLLEAGDVTGAVAKSVASGANNAAGQWSTATGLDGFDNGDSLTAFAIILDSTDPADATNYMIVNAGATRTVSFTSATGAKTLSFGSQANNT